MFISVHFDAVWRGMGLIFGQMRFACSAGSAARAGKHYIPDFPLQSGIPTVDTATGMAHVEPECWFRVPAQHCLQDSVLACLWPEDREAIPVYFAVRFAIGRIIEVRSRYCL